MARVAKKKEQEVNYADEDPECFDRGCVDLKIAHMSVRDE